MRSEESLILLSGDGTIAWANKAAADLLGYSRGELLQMGLPFVGKSGKAAASLGPVADEFQVLLAGGMTEVEGDARFPDNHGKKVAVHWKLSILPKVGGQTQVLLALSETAQASAEGPVTASYRDVFEYAVEGIFRTTVDGQILEVNPALARMFGFSSPAEFMNSVRDLNTQLYVQPSRRTEFVRVILEQGFVAGFESEFFKADGTVIWLAVFARAVRGENRALLYFEGSMIDITERKWGEAALRQSEEKFRRLAETTRVVPFEFDAMAQIFVYVGPQAEAFLGPKFRSGLTLEVWASMLHPEDFENGTRFARESACRANHDFQTEFRIQTPDGSLMWIKQIMHREAGDDRRDRVRGFLFDVTDAKTAEEERERSRIQLRELAARIQEVREEERTSIAREIHDELGQALTLWTIDLAWLSQRLASVVAEDVRKPLEEKIGTMEQMIHWTLLSVRRILSALRPPLLDDVGLKEAIEFQMEEFSKRMGIRYELDAVPIQALPMNFATAIFRIFQEALTNVARHANASRIRVCLRVADTRLVLKVQDNGCGISQKDLLHSKSFGLLGMQERAWAMGGELEIYASPRSGTTVTLTIPLTVGTPALTGRAVAGAA